MKIVRCMGKESHYIDSDIFDRCPVCQAELAKEEGAPAKEDTGKGPRHWFPFGNNNGGKNNSESKSGNVGANNSGSDVTVPLPVNTGGDVTVPLANREETVPLGPLGTPAEYIPASACEVKEPDFLIQKDPVAPPIKSVQDTPKVSNDFDSLKAIVKEASANEEGKTMGYFGSIMEQSSRKDKIVDPVVGWLVCVQGEYLGDAFGIYTGINAIGRSSNNRIVLDQDQTISREKHALLTFEPKHKVFYLKPGDSSGLTYLNGEYITDTKQIKKNDKIEMGGGVYIFIPLCDESFSWDEYIKR